MLNQDYTSTVLDLEGVIVTKTEKISDELHIYLELPRKEHLCPACGCVTNTVHDYRMQKIKDIPLGRTTYLHLRKRRYRCSCGHRFYEMNSFLPRYYRVTSRLVTKVICAFSGAKSAKDIGREANISGMTAMRYFRCVNYSLSDDLPEVLSIDEFKGNSGGQKYNTILTDPQRHRILDILPNRFENDLIHYFSQFSSKTNVKSFVCDMNPHFRNVAERCFPNAKIIADRYHVIRQVHWAMERVRKSEQNRLSARFRIYFKHSKYLLSKPLHKMSVEEMDALALMLEIAPRLAAAYRMKNAFLSIMRLKSSAEARKPLADWIFAVEKMDLPEFSDCAKAYHNWFCEILNSLDAPWSNGFTEGCNNKTKLLKRITFGMRNFRNFRNRILFASKN